MSRCNHESPRPDDTWRPRAGRAGLGHLILVALPILLLVWLAVRAGPGGGRESDLRDDRQGGSVLAGFKRGVPPALDYKTSSLDPAGDGWSTEVLGRLAEDQLGLLADALARPGDLDVEGASALAEPDFHCELARAPAPTQVCRSASFHVTRGTFTTTGGARHAGPAGLVAVLQLLTGSFGAQCEVRAEFELFRIFDVDQEAFSTECYYQALGRTEDGVLLQQNARWICGWRSSPSGGPRLTSLAVRDLEEVRGRADPTFVDCTPAVLGADPAYHANLRFGVPYWNARLDQALGTTIFGHNGLAVGDFDGDGLEDLYACQPGGLPNLLLVQNADGSATDRGAEGGVDFLDLTRSALALDLDDDGDQDLVVGTHAIVFLENDGRGHFRERSRFGTSDAYSMASADFDSDGDLDVFVCRYTQTDNSTPTPYYDANNGQPNVYLRNAGGWRFEDATAEVGLDENNRRYSFAVAGVDYDEDGDVDLYVANDFGRNNLYENEGGRFRDVAARAGVEDISAGMSAAWGDYDNDGAQDLYVGNMFSAAGSRITGQGGLLRTIDREALGHYQRHARGNALFESLGDGTFADVSVEAGVTMGRWAWAARFCDVDNDGLEDLLVANGYMSNQDPEQL